MSVSVGQPNSYQGDFRELADDIKKYRKKGYKVVCVISSAERADRFTACMKDEGVDGFFYGDDMDGQRYLEVIVGELGSGLECKSNKFLLLTENEIYGRRKKRQAFCCNRRGIHTLQLFRPVPGRLRGTRKPRSGKVRRA